MEFFRWLLLIEVKVEWLYCPFVEWVASIALVTLGSVFLAWCASPWLLLLSLPLGVLGMFHAYWRD